MDPVAAYHWATSLPADEAPAVLLHILIEMARAGSPEQASGLVENATARRNAAGRIAEEWAKQNPERALKWSLEFAEKAHRPAMVRGVFARWGSRNPGQALRQLEDLEPPYLLAGAEFPWMEYAPTCAGRGTSVLATGIADQAEEIARRIRGLTSQTVAKPVLVYFDIVGICWPIRCLLHLKRVDYELVKIPIQAWAHQTADGKRLLPASFRNDHVPLYVDSDVYLTQSNVIMSYLAGKHDLLGDSPSERLAIMEVMAHAYDALFHWSGLFQVNIRMNTAEEVVQSRLQAFMGNGSWGLLSDGYHRNLDAFERYMDANPDRASGFIVGSRLSVADLHAFNVLCNWYKAFDRTSFVESYPRLDDYVHRIASIPEVQEYIRHHQEPTLWFPLPQLALRLTSPEELTGLW